MLYKRRCASKPPRDGTPCGYCFSEWATGWDHLIPVSHGGNNSKANRYPSCGRCNSILYNKIFDSVGEKREYVRQALIQKGDWDVRELPAAVHQDSVLEKVLFISLQMGSLGPKKSKADDPDRPKTDSRCWNCHTPYVSYLGIDLAFCSRRCKRFWPSVYRRIKRREKIERENDVFKFELLLPYPSF